MTIKRHMATAAPYIISSLVMFAVTKSNANAQASEHLQAAQVSLTNYSLNEKMARNMAAEKVYDFLAAHPFTLNDFDLGDYKFTQGMLEHLTGSQQNQDVLRVARKRATRTGSFSYCYRGVKRILSNSGIKLGPIANERSAYMAATSLGHHPDFIEIKCDIADIPNLPDGTVIVWGRSKSRPDGHIEIKDGDIGRCDARYKLRTTPGPYTAPAFFVLRDTNLDMEAALKLIQENRLKISLLDSISNSLSIPVEFVTSVLGIDNHNQSQIDLAQEKPYTSFVLPDPAWIKMPRAEPKVKFDSGHTSQQAAYDKYMQKVMYIRSKKRDTKTQRSRT